MPLLNVLSLISRRILLHWCYCFHGNHAVSNFHPQSVGKWITIIAAKIVENRSVLAKLFRNIVRVRFFLDTGYISVMWSETVGLRTKPVWDQKIGLVLSLGLAHCGLGLGLADLILCCETRSCHARRHNDLEGHSNFSSTIYSFSLFCAWNSSTVENWRSTVAFT